jgi:hypothetical protein
VSRLAAIVLIVSIALLGSGALERVHNDAHARDHELTHNEHADTESSSPEPTHHDDSNCSLHAQLHLPLLPAGYVPLLVSLGLLVAFLTQLLQTTRSLSLPQRLDCRGPPNLL